MKKSHKNYPFRKVNFDGNFLYSLDCTNTLAKETEWGNWTLVVLWCWLLGCHWRSTSGVLALAPAVTWVPGQASQAVTSQHMWGHHVQDMDVELLLFCWTQSRHIVSQLLCVKHSDKSKNMFTPSLFIQVQLSHFQTSNVQISILYTFMTWNNNYALIDRPQLWMFQSKRKI